MDAMTTVVVDLETGGRGVAVRELHAELTRHMVVLAGELLDKAMAAAEAEAASAGLGVSTITYQGRTFDEVWSSPNYEFAKMGRRLTCSLARVGRDGGRVMVDLALLVGFDGSSCVTVTFR